MTDYQNEQAYAYESAPVQPPEKAWKQMQKPLQKAERRAIRKDTGYMAWASCAMILFSNLVVIPLVLFGAMTSPGPAQYSNMSCEMYYLLQCVAAAVATPSMFLVFALAKRVDFSEYLQFKRVKISHCLLYIGYGVLICLLANIPVQWLSEVITDAGYTDITLEMAEPDSVLASAAFAVGLMVLPPLMEEFAFRGIVLSHLRRHGDWFAVLVSSLLFAMVHGNAVQIPFAFLAGLVLGVTYVKTNNLAVPIIIHALNNGMSVVTELLLTWCGESVAVDVSNAMYLTFLILGILAAVILLVMAFFGHNLLSMKRPEHTVLTRRGRLWACVSSAGFITLFGYTIFSCVMYMMM